MWSLDSELSRDSCEDEESTLGTVSKNEETGHADVDKGYRPKTGLPGFDVFNEVQRPAFLQSPDSQTRPIPIKERCLSSSSSSKETMTSIRPSIDNGDLLEKVRPLRCHEYSMIGMVQEDKLAVMDGSFRFLVAQILPTALEKVKC